MVIEGTLKNYYLGKGTRGKQSNFEDFVEISR